VNCFPQLTTGATGQFPIRKRRTARTVVNEACDGRQIKWPDTGNAIVEWELLFEGINDDERQRIEQFFADMEGRLRSFTFLDPTGNLLEWSEKLTEPIWEKDPQLRLTPGMADPVGSMRATTVTNDTAADGQLRQTLNAPGGYVYAFSLHARSTSGGEVRLSRSSGGILHEASYDLGVNWKRLLLTGGFDSVEETVQFGLQVGAQTSAEVFGLQVEAQPAASTYKKTFSRGGIHAGARFQADLLEMTCTGPGQHSGRVTIEAKQ
jgi:hypothetical protein